jgi:hypothetical protein
MAKKAVFWAILVAVMSFSSCDNGSAGSGSAPVLEGVFIAQSEAGLTGNTETTSFRVGDRAWFRFTVIDEELDADKIMITQQNGSLVVGPGAMLLEKQNAVTQYYFGYMDVEIEGEWVISAYCLDKKGNKSNTVTKTVTVTK